MAKGSNVSVEVYNITGQKVYFHDYGYKAAGSFTMTLHTNGLPSGVYFYSVEAGATKVTHKMVVK